MSSPLGANVYHCVTRCGQDIDSILLLTPAAIDQCFWLSISPNDVCTANLLAELLLLRSGVLTFSSSGFSPPITVTVTDVRITLRSDSEAAFRKLTTLQYRHAEVSCTLTRINSMSDCARYAEN